MKHAVIVGHPNPKSFNLAVAEAYAATARTFGDEVVLRDLYAIRFDPRLGGEEIPHPSGFSPSANVLMERNLIGDADIFALIYPLWFMVPPAILTGYIQRVFGMGFGYGPISGGGNVPLLTGRKLGQFYIVRRAGILGKERRALDRFVRPFRQRGCGDVRDERVRSRAFRQRLADDAPRCVRRLH